MVLLFVRHAKTQIDESIPTRSWHLSEKGKAQANQVNVKLQKRTPRIARVVCSTEPKSIQTMRPYAEEMNIEIISEPTFDELHFNKYYSYDKFVKYRRHQFTNDEFSIDGSETASDALSRFNEGLTKLEDAIVCTHGTILTLYLAEQNNWSGRQAFDYWKDLEFGAIIDHP